MDEGSDWIRYLCKPKAGDEIEKLQEIVDTKADMPKVVYFLLKRKNVLSKRLIVLYFNVILFKKSYFFYFSVKWCFKK